jgi:hypothetical protein
MPFHKFVSLERTPQEKAEKMADMMGAAPRVPDFPFGWTFCMDETDLEKLDLDDEEVEVGDTIHLVLMARVTSVSKRQEEGRDCCRIELQGEQVAIETPPENKEMPGDGDD